ncbi:MAG TPA: hypothetical protein PL162_08880, partial [Synergistaceae bacterium]|nr:hypothetical protein [Synergistaceae bacterium]
VHGASFKKTLGQYPEVGLKDARLRRDKLRASMRRGDDGLEEVTFASLAEEWFSRKVESVRAPGHSRTVRSRLDRLILPYLGHRPPGAISAPEVLAVLRRIEDRGHVETAHRAAQIVGQIFRYGIAVGKADRDVAADLRGAIIPRTPNPLPHHHRPRENRRPHAGDSRLRAAPQW